MSCLLVWNKNILSPLGGTQEDFWSCVLLLIFKLTCLRGMDKWWWIKHRPLSMDYPKMDKATEVK